MSDTKQIESGTIVRGDDPFQPVAFTLSFIILICYSWWVTASGSPILWSIDVDQGFMSGIATVFGIPVLEALRLCIWVFVIYAITGFLQSFRGMREKDKGFKTIMESISFLIIYLVFLLVYVGYSAMNHFWFSGDQALLISILWGVISFFLWIVFILGGVGSFFLIPAMLLVRLAEAVSSFTIYDIERDMQKQRSYQES